jgi:hypothetical protein
MTLELHTVHADGTLSQYATPETIEDYTIAERLADRLRAKGIYQDVRIIATETEKGV